MTEVSENVHNGYEMAGSLWKNETRAAEVTLKHFRIEALDYYDIR